MTDSMSLPNSHGLARSWGHYAPQLLAIAVLGVIVLGFSPHAVTTFTLVSTVLLLVFVLITWLRLREHDRQLCELCAASMPLNAAEHAARLKRRFWVTHAGANPRLMLPYVAVLIGANFLTSTPGRVIWALVESSMIYLIVCHSSHRKLQPWCQWCSGGGGGTDELDPDPDLPRGNQRQLV